MASSFRISVLLSAAAIFCATGVTVSFADTIASVLDGSGNDLLAASSPNLAVSLNEGSAITAYVKLNRKPKSEVRIAFASSGLLELDVYNPSSNNYRGGLTIYSAPPVLIFDSSNWNIPQTVSMQSIEDGTADGARTLPVRMSISTRGRATVTNPIWVHSLDSGTVSGTATQPFQSSGTIDKISKVGPDNNLTRLSDAAASASYDGTKGTAKFRVNSIKLNIRNRVIEVGYTIDAQNKVIVEQVLGFNPRDLSLDLNYVPVDTYYGSFGLSGVMTIRQRGGTDVLFVTSTAKNSCDIAQYAGRWYEQGSAKTKVSAKLLNATYTYTPRLDGNVDVEYAGSYGDINGAIQSAFGVATPVSDVYSYSTNTQFNVLYSSWNSVRPPSSDYRIVDFAPDYSWAIASDSFGGNGVVLTRDQIIEDATYNALLNRAKWLGVRTTKFMRTVQIAPP